MSDNNKEILAKKLIELINGPIFTALKIYSRGNIVYLLKDYNSQIFVLLIPNRPLEIQSSESLIQLGYKEIWEKVNYTMDIDYSNPESLLQMEENMETVFTQIFKLDANQLWRFETMTGMEILKNTSEPHTTAEENRNSNIASRKKRNRIANDYTYTAGLALIIFLVIIRNNLFNISLLEIPIITIVSYLLVKYFRSDFELDFGKWRFFSSRYSDYFYKNGFVKIGNKYQGEIKGYKTELSYNTYQKCSIYVYHQAVDWNQTFEFPKGGYFSRRNYNWSGMFYSQLYFMKVLSKAKTIKEANDFVDLIIQLKIEKESKPIKEIKH